MGSVFQELVTLARRRGTAFNHLPKSVDLLFRALPKASTLSSPKDTQDTSAEQVTLILPDHHPHRRLN